MAKNPNKKAKALQKDEQMNGAMKFFLAGCVAELYLLIIRRFYINADSELSRIAWYDRYLWMLAGIGAGVLAVGLIVALTAKANAGRRKTGWALAGARCVCWDCLCAGALEYGNAVPDDHCCPGGDFAGCALGAV